MSIFMYLTVPTLEQNPNPNQNRNTNACTGCPVLQGTGYRACRVPAHYVHRCGALIYWWPALLDTLELGRAGVKWFALGMSFTWEGTHIFVGTAKVFQVSCLKVSRTIKVVLGFDLTFTKRIIGKHFKRILYIYFLYFSSVSIFLIFFIFI